MYNDYFEYLAEKNTLFEERSPFSKIRLDLDSKLDGRFTQILLTFKYVQDCTPTVAEIRKQIFISKKRNN